MSRPKLLHPWPMPSKLISYHCHYSPSNKWLSSKAQRLYISTRDFTPRILQPSLWQSVIPKAIRERISKPKRGKQQKGYNPATFFIVIFLVIGSNAIQMIGLRNDARSFSRRSEAKIGLLKEVIERVQRGEKIDVEGLLGTGDERKEQEWEKGAIISGSQQNPSTAIQEADRILSSYSRYRRRRRKLGSDWQEKEGQAGCKNARRTTLNFSSG